MKGASGFGAAFTSSMRRDPWDEGKGGGKGKGMEHWMGVSTSGKNNWAAQAEEPRLVCAVHGKKRTSDNLQEAHDGTLVCVPGNECMRPGIKRHLCSFFARGACQRGDACSFAHDDAQLGQPVLGTVDGEFDGVNGMDVGWAAAKGKGKSGGDGGPTDRILCSVHSKARRADCMMEDGDGAWRCLPGLECRDAATDGEKRAFCKFFRQGACQRGEACAFAHHEAEVKQIGSIEDQSVTSSPAVGTGGSNHQSAPHGKGGWRGTSNGRSPTHICAIHQKKRRPEHLVEEGDYFVCKPGSECKDLLGEAEGTPCKFFAQGTCQRGEACVFSHESGPPAQKGAKGGWGAGHWYAPY